MVISTLKAATRKRTRKVRSNSHTGQCHAGSISPDHSQGQTLVEPLALPPWDRQTHQQVSSQDHSKKGLWTCHTHQWSQVPLVVSGNCVGGHDIFGILRPQLLWPQDWPVWESLYSGPEQSVHNCCVPHQAQASVPGAQSQAIRPPSIVSQAHRFQDRGEANTGQE